MHATEEVCLGMLTFILGMEYNSRGSRKKSCLSSHEGTAHKNTCKQKYKLADLARGQENNKNISVES